MKTIKVKLTFTEPLLGTWPANPNVAREYIASKGPDASTIEDEVAALGADAAADRAMTVFPRNEAGQPILYDYQLKGFFKDSCGMLGAHRRQRREGQEESSERIRQADSLQEDHRRPDFWSGPRQIPLILSGEMTECPAPPAGPDSPGRTREPCQLRADSSWFDLRVRDHLHGRCPRKKR